MVEHTVQKDPHPHAVRLPAEGPKILFRTQQRVDGLVVCGVVAVVGGGFKDGVQVQGGDPQRGQVGEFGGDAPQSAAEKVPVSDLALRIRLPVRKILPVLVNIAVPDQAGDLCGVLRQTAESIWKNLVCHAGAEPGGRGGIFIYGQLPGVTKAVTAVSGPVQVTAAAVLPPETEMVPDQLRSGRGRKGEGKTHPLPLRAAGGELMDLFALGEFKAQHQCTVGKGLGEQGTAVEGERLSARHGAEGRFAKAAAGIKNEGFAHGADLLWVGWYGLIGGAAAPPQWRCRSRRQ